MNVSPWLKSKSKNVKYVFTKSDSFTQEFDPHASPFAAGAGDGTQGTCPPDEATLLAQRRARKQNWKATNNIAPQEAQAAPSLEVAAPSIEVVANAGTGIKKEMPDECVETNWDSRQLVRPAVTPDSNGLEPVELYEVKL